jgi:hypothetical protein
VKTGNPKGHQIGLQVFCGENDQAQYDRK